MLSLAACGDSSADIIKKKDGKTYIVLPDSKQEIACYDYCEVYLDEVDAELLKAAEKKISEDVSEYDDDVMFDITAEDGELYLYSEVIVYVDESETSDDLCGGDHIHKVFKERITK